MKLLKTAAEPQPLSHEFCAYISDFISILRRKLETKISNCELKEIPTKFSVCRSKNFPELKPQNRNFNWFASKQQLFRSILMQSKEKTLPFTPILPHKLNCTNSNTPCVPRATISEGGTGRPVQNSLVTQALQSQQSKDKALRFRQLRMRDDELAKFKGPVLCAFCEVRLVQTTLKQKR